MAIEEAQPHGAVRQEENGPPCKRCGGRSWNVEGRPERRPRWLAQTLIAAPVVRIFQSESGGRRPRV